MSMILPSSTVTIAILIQTYGSSKLHEDMKKTSWGEMLGTNSAYLFLKFLPILSSFLHQLYALIVINSQGKPPFSRLLEYLIDEVRSRGFTCKNY